MVQAQRKVWVSSANSKPRIHPSACCIHKGVTLQRHCYTVVPECDGSCTIACSFYITPWWLGLGWDDDLQALLGGPLASPSWHPVRGDESFINDLIASRCISKDLQRIGSKVL